ncbi:MAG: hypothetical protein GYA02_13690 [Clostridiaceae bacterium]|jgi:DNA-binding IclR family transcriptional regulator|nr:hypothetical protein [Clostridiaceae bacterium]
MIKVLHKALDILEFVSYDKNRTYSLTEIAQEIDEKPTTCANIIKTLLDREYVERVGKRGYKLGIMAFSIVNISGYDIELVNKAKNPLKELSESINSSAVLSVLKNNRKHVLLRIESNSIIKVNPAAMDISDPYETSTGLVLLAYQPDSIIDDLIEQNGLPLNFTNEEDYRNFLSSIRKEGYLSMTVKKEVAEVATPVKSNGNVIAAIGVYMPKYKFTPEFQKKVIESIIKTSTEISDSLENKYENKLEKTTKRL